MNKEDNEENYKDIINSMLMYFIFFCCKCLIKFLILCYSNRFSSTISVEGNNTIQKNPIDTTIQLIEQIKKLKEEAEQHNTQSEFVLHTKLIRQIAKLEKELKLITNNPSSSVKTFETPLHSILPSNIPINFDIKGIGIEAIFWCISTVIFISARKASFTVLYEKYRDNCIVNYYHAINEDYAHIPFNLILFCESMALNQIRKIGNKLII